MAWFQRLKQSARDTDPLAAWGERISKVLGWFLLWVVGPSALSGIGLAALAYLTTYSFLYAAAFGFAAFAFVQVGLSLLAIRRSAAATGPPVEQETQSVASQPAPAEHVPQQAVDWKTLRLGIPTTEDARDRLMKLAAENEQLTSPNPVVELLADNERARNQLRTERDEARAEIDTLKQELEEIRRTSVSQESSPGDEELKQRCLQLSGQLFRFLEDRGKEDPQNKPGWTVGNPLSSDPESRKRSQELVNYNNETMTQYSQLYGGEVGAVLEALERRGWCDSEGRKKLESQLENPLLSPTTRIRQMAQRLAAFGHRLDKSTGQPDDDGRRAEDERLRAEIESLKEELARMGSEPDDEDDEELKRRSSRNWPTSFSSS